MESQKRSSVSLQQKIEIIRAVESQPHKNKTAIAKEKGVPRTTLMNIMKNKSKYKEQFECGKEVLSRKKSRGCRDSELDAALLKWFSEQR